MSTWRMPRSWYIRATLVISRSCPTGISRGAAEAGPLMFPRSLLVAWGSCCADDGQRADAHAVKTMSSQVRALVHDGRLCLRADEDAGPVVGLVDEHPLGWSGA